jgi:hypothetical protein
MVTKFWDVMLCSLIHPHMACSVWFTLLTLKMEAERSSKMSVNFYQLLPEDSHS